MRGRRYLRLMATGVSLMLLVLSLAPAAASSANISHAYHSSSTIPNGSIVSLDPSRTNYVEPANLSNGSRLLGVALNSSDSLLAVDPTPGSVQVATSGNVSTLVSTLGGNISVGDQIAVSPFDGVGMKALSGSRVIGLAQTPFSATTSGAAPEQVTGKDGKKSSVYVGYVQVSIAITTNVTVTSPDSNLTGLQKFAKNLTGHTVSTARVAISLAVALVTILALVTLTYASIYGSIISIGRNPLAKYAVFRTLGSVLGLAVMTVLIAGLIIFFLLR